MREAAYRIAQMIAGETRTVAPDDDDALLASCECLAKREPNTVAKVSLALIPR